MQNNVTELTDKLLRALDTNYNVTDMQTVIDIIVLLDKVAITKEVLEATRLGKYVNELRRNTSNDWLAKRAKELVKKWRNLVLPPLQQQHQQVHDHSATTNNGQVKTIAHAPAPVVRDKLLPQPLDGGGGAQAQNLQQEDCSAGGGVSRKRSAKDKIDANSSGITSKRLRMNGGSELDLSDTSNSSFHDAVLARNELRLAKASVPAPAHAPSVILVNSDSNSSLPDVKTQLISQDSITIIPPRQTTPSLPTTTLTPPLTSPSSTSSLHPQTTSPALTNQQQPNTPSSNTLQSQQQKRRGRRKGSSAHRNLLDEADASFTSKMARGANARVKTTQELVASLQGARGVGVSAVGGVVGAGKAGVGVGGKEDLVQKAAKLTERVVEIDQKLNTNANRYKNNGGSTTTTTPSGNKHHHHHYRYNNNNNNNNNNSLSNNFGTSEGDDEDVIVVDEDDVTVRHHQPQRSGRHRKRRDSAANKLVVDDDNVTIKHEDAVNEAAHAQEPARSLDTALALSLLPPIDHSDLTSQSPSCSCRLIDNTDANLITTSIINSASATKKRSDFSIGGTDDEDDDDVADPPQEMLAPYEWERDDDCSAEEYLRGKYRLCNNLNGSGVDSDVVKLMHERYIPGVNCNTQPRQQLVIQQSDNDDNVVPDVYRNLQRKLEAYKPYSISEGSDDDKVEVDDKERTTVAAAASGDGEFREFHEVLDVPSYNGETLRILPYVIID